MATRCVKSRAEVAERLAADPEPAVRALARRDLLGRAPDADVLAGPVVRGPLAGPQDAVARPYAKWRGAHWRLVAQLLAGRRPDGGWNCDRRPDARRSSVHETLPALWGLHEYRRSDGGRRLPRRGRCGGRGPAGAPRRFRGGDRPSPPSSVLDLHYPPYWHYDVLQALVVLDRCGFAGDPRSRSARDVVAAKQRRDGEWRAVRRWWRPPGSPSYSEAVDWAETAHAMVTLNALRVLR